MKILQQKMLKFVFSICMFIMPINILCNCCCGCDDECKTDIQTTNEKTFNKHTTVNNGLEKCQKIKTIDILRTLKIDGDNLTEIVEEIKKINNIEDKISKIVEYIYDIDENPVLPNCLIKQELEACAYITYFHLMLSNPYFFEVLFDLR